MSKFSLDLKIKIVEEYLSGISSPKLERKYGVGNHFSIYNWASRYKKFGVEGLKARNNRIQYDGDFKLKVLEWKKSHHATYSDTALRFDISNTGTIANWQKKYNQEGSLALFGRFTYYDPGKIEHSEIERLRKENLNLISENERLRNINALIQMRDPSTDKNVYVKEKELCDEQVLDLIKQIKREHFNYGYRSVTHELKKMGYSINHKRVLRIMNEHSLTCKNINDDEIITEGLLQ